MSPTRLQVPGAGHDTAVRPDPACAPVPAPAGVGAVATVQVVPDSVSIMPSVCPVAFSYWPTAVQVPAAGQATEPR